MNKLTLEQINDLKRLYLDEKLSAYKIAEMMGVEKSTISYQLKRLGVEMRPRGENTRKLTPEQISDLKRLYVDEKLSAIKIAEMMGVEHSTIYNHLKRLGVETRPVETKLTLADLRRLYVDEKLSAYKIAKMMGVDHKTIYYHLKRLGVEMRSNKLTPEQINDLPRLYVDEKLSAYKIAEMMGVEKSTISYQLKRLGVGTRTVETKLTPEQISDLKRLYVDEKLSTIKIAKMMGVSQSNIYNHLKRLGVETRPVETKLTQAKINDLKRLYVDEKLSAIKIAEMMGVEHSNIYKHLKRLGVETRPVETKLTPEQINDLKRLYVDEKLSAIKIAEMMGVEHSTIYKHLKRLGVGTRTGDHTLLTPEQISDLRRLYLEEKLYPIQIATMMGVAYITVYKQIKRLGVEMRSNKLTQAKINDLKRLYVDEKLSAYKIAEMMGVEHSTISTHLKRLGVEMRSNKLTPEQINDLPRLYVDEKLSTIKIAEMMGVEHSTIYKHLKRLGVETRPRR